MRQLFLQFGDMGGGQLPEKTPETILATVQESKHEQIAFKYHWEQSIEDLRDLLGIHVKDQQELESYELRVKVYAKVLEDLKDGNTFCLEQFFLEDNVISRNDFKKEDMPAIKQYAVQILENTRSNARRTTAKSIFEKTGILTHEEVQSIVPKRSYDIAH